MKRDEKSKEVGKPADKVNKELESAKNEGKADESTEEGRKSEEAKAEQPPPPPPQEIILKVYMHCEGCATKVRRCLKGFEGVEDVSTDYRTSKVVVKGEKADPLKVLERIKKKSHRLVELISPIPKPHEEPSKSQEKEEIIKSEDKVEEHPHVITVVLGVHMHCEACAQEIKKRIQRMKGVESVEADLKKSQVTVKGFFEPNTLVEYVLRRTGKHAVVVATEADEAKGGGGEQKVEEGGKDDQAKKAEESGGGGGGEPPSKPAESSELEMRRSELSSYHYSTQIMVPEYEYPPQMFSDENPNACTVM
ncbi:metal ion binding protein [Dorcoceras hygrometricum]|uniref:Metal ion binding protein n=1 Tax=Dorcoceras hygrometricum TaxID=472368 RepID=A0A2Z7AJQ5_9LAMI|nr:metal ion binding protein [Dorcoceras hygrometricum]